MTTYDLPIWDELAAELDSEPSRRSPSRRRSGRPAPHATTAPCGVRGCGGARVEPCGCDHEETTDMTITITPEIQAAANSYRDAIAAVCAARDKYLAAAGAARDKYLAAAGAARDKYLADYFADYRTALAAADEARTAYADLLNAAEVTS